MLASLKKSLKHEFITLSFYYGLGFCSF